MLSLIFRYEWRRFWRNRLQVALLAVLVVFGLYAIYYGQRQIAGQRAVIGQVRLAEQTEFAGYRAAALTDTAKLSQKDAYEQATQPTLAWYRHGYAATAPPAPLAALVVGQRDLNPGYYRLTGMGLYYQLFQNELANPQKLLVGNFDLAFVLVYLLPLFIIVLSYGLLSSDRENGVLPLLHVQAASVRRLLLGKLLFGFGLVAGLAVGLSVVGFLVAGASLATDAAVLALWLLTVLVYCGFWFALVWLLVSFNRSSAVNALTAVGLWLLLLLVVPSLLNAALAVVRPVDSSRLATLVRRTGIDNEEHEPTVRAVVRTYLRQRPDLAPPAHDTLFQPNLLYKGYAAYAQLNSQRQKPLVDEYLRAIAAREALAARFNLVNPAVSTQNLLSQLAGTDLPAYLRFFNSLPAFHRRIVDFYYPRLFANQPLTAADFAARPTFRAPLPTGAGVGVGLLQLLAVAAVLFGIGYWNLPRHLRG
jgi:ABC-2 type transport system permease protein